jgi:uncharacterized protein (TIGR02246 family)
MNAEDSVLPDHSRDVEAVHALSEKLRAAVNRSDVGGIGACWASDGVMLPPNHPAVAGRNAIQDYFTHVFASRRLTFTFTQSVVAVYGDVAIERLHYTATARASDGETSEDAGKGIHVCTRLADGAWQLAQDIWNSDRAPAASAELGR